MQEEFTETPIENLLDDEAPEKDADIIEEPQGPEKEEPAPKEEPKADAPMVPLAALHEVRDELKTVKAQLTQKPVEPEPMPDPIEDPEGFANYSAKREEQFASTVEGRLYNQKVGMSEFQYAQQHGKEAAESLKEWFGTQPAHIQEEARQHPHPFAFAHELKQRNEIAEKFSDPAMREKFEAFLASSEQPSRPKAPVTTASARNVGERSGPQWAGPTPLEEILPD